MSRQCRRAQQPRARGNAAPLLFGVLLVLGCGGHDEAPPPPIALQAHGGAGGAHGGLHGCGTPQEGCVCQTPGGTESCVIYREQGDYVACYIGTITCQDDGEYGPCEGAILSPLPLP